MRNKNNNNRKSEPREVYQVGDRLRVYTMDGMRECAVKTVSCRGYWVVFENNGEVETFIKSENVAEVVEKGAIQMEVEEMGKEKKMEKKPVEKKKPEAVKPEAKKLKEPYEDPGKCKHDIVERKVRADGTYEPKGRCFDCGKALDFTETGEKKISSP